VELIADLLAVHGEARATEMAKRLSARGPTAIKSVPDLSARAWRRPAPSGILLTELGRELADRVRARRRRAGMRPRRIAKVHKCAAPPPEKSFIRPLTTF